jgi:hypothetical protein
MQINHQETIMEIRVKIPGKLTKKESALLDAVTSGEAVSVLGRKYYVITVERIARSYPDHWECLFELVAVKDIAKAKQ